MAFTPYYNLVKRRIENKIFVLSKVRKFVDNTIALGPFINYVRT